MTGSTILLVGLGNPGVQYQNTRHNIGYDVVDHLVTTTSGSWSTWKKDKKIYGSTATFRYADHKVIVLKSASYMNESGVAVRAAVDYFSLSIDSLLVIHDELDIDFGQVKLKMGGGEGGHNGLRSISSHLKSKDYPRLRLGISRPPQQVDPANYVLSKFSPAQQKELPGIITRAISAVELFIHVGFKQAQNKINAPG